MNQGAGTNKLIFLSLAMLVGPALASRPASGSPVEGTRPTASASYNHAPVTLWIAPHLGLGGMASVKLRTNVAVSLGASGYARLDGLDLGVGASLITETMKGVQVTSGFNFVGGDAEGIQLSAGGNFTRFRMTGLQVASGFNYAGADLRGVQIASGANVARQRVIGLQVASGASYGAIVDGAQISLVNIGGQVSGAQIGLVNIAARVKGPQIGLVNVAEESSAPVGLLSLVKNGQHHVAVWSSDSAPLSLGFKLGGRYVYGVLAAGLETSNDKKRWMAGVGLGGHLPIGDRFFIETELLTWHVNEDEAWTRDLNTLNTLRLIGGYRVHRYFSVFAGPSFNVLVADVGDGGGFGLIRGSRLTSERSGTTVRMWPGFVAGFQI